MEKRGVPRLANQRLALPGFPALPGYALLQGQRSGVTTRSAFAGFMWMYLMTCWRWAWSRMKRSQYSRGQTGELAANREIGVPGIPPPLSRRSSRILRAVNFFQAATIFATVHPLIGWKSAST